MTEMKVLAMMELHVATVKMEDEDVTIVAAFVDRATVDQASSPQKDRANAFPINAEKKFTSHVRAFFVTFLRHPKLGGDETAGDGEGKDGDGAQNGGDGANRRTRRFRPRNRPNKNRNEQVRFT